VLRLAGLVHASSTTAMELFFRLFA
jgi:hypothetical protein